MKAPSPRLGGRVTGRWGYEKALVSPEPSVAELAQVLATSARKRWGKALNFRKGSSPRVESGALVSHLHDA